MEEEPAEIKLFSLENCIGVERDFLGLIAQVLVESISEQSYEEVSRVTNTFTTYYNGESFHVRLVVARNEQDLEIPENEVRG